MKIQFTLALLGLSTFFANAAELLQTYPSSGVEIHATDNVLKVDAEGPNIRFFLKDQEMFVTAFIFKDTQNPYPLLSDFSKQFLNSVYSRSNYQKFFEEKVENNFANKNSDGIEYLIDLGDEKCELLLANSVGNQTYIFINISNEVTSANCNSFGKKLNSVAAQITASITIKNI